MTTMDRREALMTAGAALGGTLLPGTAAEAALHPPRIGNMSAAMAAALHRYDNRLLAIREKIWNHPWTQRADVNALANAYYMELIGQAWMNMLAWNELYPRFVTNTACEPQLANVLFMCPDFKYFWGLLDTKRTYRIRGRMRESAFLDFSAGCDMGAFEPPQRVSEANTAANAPYYYAIGEEFSVAPDGSFEFIASARPQPGNWMRLNEAWPHAVVTVRNGILDWTHDRSAWIDIQLLDPIDRRTLDHTEDELIARLDRAGRFIEFYYDYYANYLVEAQLRNAGGQYNVWAVQNMPKSFGQTQKGRPQNLVYDIADDEALVIEHEDPGPVYWGFQLADRYARGTDPAYFQSSLNQKQARRDSDGRYRMVVANHDPGVPNWLDTAGRLTGILRLRQYHQQKDVATPTATKVRLADVHRHLPADTPRITAAERAAVMEERRQGMLRRFGYLPYDEPLLP
ncbi:MAG: hypothetical protein AB7Q97_22795 [Gammaproteobacteria bacterium]